ncbi:spore germination protein [Virgibacillus sp. 179-BFC.A HS]|uniref:Spore germination protein n=1 Tax=Tigheibacillus jepli TaxID=3035914 RepID=A0ABU5CJS2_9BACI|nr:spore germination protein [Virgibacillus sp. 179-BFC.A HS]MDY0406049.1 spore germination protein [Virgibacillus sp. 179-BFC.A HS]
MFKKTYSYPDNADIVLRKIKVPSLNKEVATLFIKTITDENIVDKEIIKPLTLSTEDKKIDDILTGPSVKKNNQMKDIINAVNQGNTAVIVDGELEAYIVDSSKFASRSVSEPDTEKVVKGPNEGFNEQVMINISLIRKRIRSENLMFETQTVSKRAKNQLYIAYDKGLVNDDLLKKVKSRINQLDVDEIQTLAVLEQYIEDRPQSLFPSILYTVRPDRAVNAIENGFIVLMMDNSPDCLVVPATFWSFFHASEDQYLRVMFGNFTRGLRIIGIFITLFISSIYVALTDFHTEMIPPDLLLAIASTREKVPFPIIVEVLIMELEFELIREAGIRVPAPIGPTIGIVGALILGEAAVQANIVSPIVVIVVALGGLSSFVIGDISLNFSIRIGRYFLIVAAYLFGIYGMTALFIIGLAYMSSLKSFGVPYLAPMTPSYQSSDNTLFRKTQQQAIFRPGYLKPKDMQKKQVKQDDTT